MKTTETIEGIDQDRRGLLGAVTMGIAVAGAASLSSTLAAAADENAMRPSPTSGWGNRALEATEIKRR